MLFFTNLIFDFSNLPLILSSLIKNYKKANLIEANNQSDTLLFQRKLNLKIIQKLTYRFLKRPNRKLDEL
jgi:hypothetical protein